MILPHAVRQQINILLDAIKSMETVQQPIQKNHWRRVHVRESAEDLRIVLAKMDEEQP